MSSMQQPDPPYRHPPVGKRMRYGDDYDEFDVGNPRIDAEENASAAGMVSFIFAAVAIGLIVVIAILWFFLREEEAQKRNIDRHEWMLLWFMCLDVLSFFAALTATVFGARGLSQYNPLYRGWAMTGLTLGIIEMVGTMIFFFFITCNFLLFKMMGGG
jgi:hypothetical protein